MGERGICIRHGINCECLQRTCPHAPICVFDLNNAKRTGPRLSDLIHSRPANERVQLWKGGYRR